MKIIDQSVRILYPDSPDEGVRAMRRIEYAGRNCYRTQDKITPESYIGFTERLAQRGHTAPLEFADVMVEIVTSRDVMAEITRHRHASFCIQSQRYVTDDKTGEISFIRPLFYVPNDGDKTDAKHWCASRKWEQAMAHIEEDYKYLKHDCSMPSEDARKVLPNSTATVIVMKCNVRELLHILNLRSSSAAYPEMREMIRLLEERLKQVMPHALRLKELVANES